MKKYIALFLMSISLSACSYFHPYRPTIQQGNMMNQEHINQLKVGMTARQIADIMGTPVLENSFNDNEAMYVYMQIPNHGQVVYKRVTLYLQNGRLAKIEKVNVE